MVTEHEETKSREAFIVSHTHWDREWYRTFDEFRTNLAYVVREALDYLEHDPDFRHFLLDGQAIILDDYLEVHPEDRERICALVGNGSLAVGPWYILPDEFLVSGEATVRNLLIGHRIGDAVGGVQKVGYLPDSFGHIAQMPQILRGAGIDSFVYTRGNGDEIEQLGYEYLWGAPNGAEVLAINQCEGYCAAGGLGLEKGWHALTQRAIDPARAVVRVRELLSHMEVLARGHVFLISNGCDHYPPQRELGTILHALRNAFPDTEFCHSSLAAYIDRVKALRIARARHSGELIRGRDQFVLQGVWSSRMYLKQLNDRAQTLLGNVAEPLAAYAHFMYGRRYAAGLIDQAWRLLLQNHPHDSICGCSTDRVHRHMVPRFERVIDTAQEEVRRLLVDFAPTFARRAEDDAAAVLAVANPLPIRRNEIVERLLLFGAPGPDARRLRISDANGNTLRHDVVDCHYVDRFWDVDYRTELAGSQQRELFLEYLDAFPNRISRDASAFPTADCFITIRFLAEDLPALGHATYRVTANGNVGPGRTTTDSVSVTHNTIENQFYAVMVHANGTLDITDKRNGTALRGLNCLVDVEDVGDEYDYAPAHTSMTVTAAEAAGSVEAVACSPLLGTIEAAFSLRLPAHIARDRARRARETVDCPVRVRVTLTQDRPLIDIELVIDNLAKDHRLRAAFPTGIRTDTVISDGHFYVNHRSIAQPDGAGWVQPPAGTYPQQRFSALEAEGRGLAILSPGLPEIEATTDEQGCATLLLTLLRSVGWLSRDDLDTRRRRNAGPMVPTPDAQCLGRHRFRYAVVPYSLTYVAAGISALSERFRVPVVSVQGVEDRHTPGGTGLVVQRTHLTQVSAVKKHVTRNTLVVRLYNLVGDPVVETLTFGRAIQNVWRTNLLEERLGPIQADQYQVDLNIQPHEIVTLEIEFIPVDDS